MMKENNNEKILLENVSNKLRNARKLAPNVPYELHDFADYLARSPWKIIAIIATNTIDSISFI